jgi:hypothetical protein
VKRPNQKPKESDAEPPQVFHIGSLFCILCAALRLGLVMNWLREGEAVSANSLPVEFMVGKPSPGRLNDQQHWDLLRHVQMCERSNRPLSKQAVLQNIWKFVLFNKGLVSPLREIDWDGYCKHLPDMEMRYRRWLCWCRQAAAEGKIELDDVPRNRKLKGLKPQEAADCTPEVCQSYFDNIRTVLEESGIMVKGVSASLASAGNSRASDVEQDALRFVMPTHLFTFLPHVRFFLEHCICLGALEG